MKKIILIMLVLISVITQAQQIKYEANLATGSIQFVKGADSAILKKQYKILSITKINYDSLAPMKLAKAQRLNDSLITARNKKILQRRANKDSAIAYVHTWIGTSTNFRNMQGVYRNYISDYVDGDDYIITYLLGHILSQPYMTQERVLKLVDIFNKQ